MNNATHNEMSVNKAWSGRGTLKDLVDELDRQKATKLDVCVDARDLFVEVAKGGERGSDRRAVARGGELDREH